MNWLILVILAVLLFFVFRIWRTRRIAAQTLKRRNLETSESEASGKSLAKNVKNTSSPISTNGISANGNTASSNAPITKPHDSPSLRYADRSTDSTTTVAGISNEVAANSDEHASSHSASHSTKATGDAAINATTESNVSTNTSDSSSNTGVAAAAGIAGAALGAASMRAISENQSALNSDPEATSENDSNSAPGLRATRTYTNTDSGFNAEKNQTSDGLANTSSIGANTDVGIVGVVGAAVGAAGIASAGSTYDDKSQYEDNEEDIDFSDMTVDVSEMIKELNLRESDSPRLEISDDEFAQLKTGEPGEVQTKKIKNVAGKLEKMLQ